MTESLVFYVASAISVLAVLLMIFQKNPVTSAVFLILSFFGLAVVYLTLDAHFVAALQILVYAGAIMVLFMFVIMLLNLKDEELVYEKLGSNAIVAVLISGTLFSFLAYYFFSIQTEAFPEVVAGFGTAKAVGKSLMSDYVLAFELIGVLLLVGLIGAVLLGKREED